MRISDWSSDVCSSDLCPQVWYEGLHRVLVERHQHVAVRRHALAHRESQLAGRQGLRAFHIEVVLVEAVLVGHFDRVPETLRRHQCGPRTLPLDRSEEHTSELQSLMRSSYAVFCLNKKTTTYISESNTYTITT